MTFDRSRSAVAIPWRLSGQVAGSRVRRVLVQGVKDFIGRVRERAVGAEILQSLTAGQQIVKIVNDELVTLLGAGDRTFHLTGNPAVVAMVGLQGSGKTTSSAKLARYLVRQG